MKLPLPHSIALLLALAQLASLRAADLHVSPSGNDTNDGSLAAPFLTIARALAVAQPGDSAKLHAGTYREAIKPMRSGTAQSPITIENYNGEQAVISACDVVSGPWTAQGNGIYTASVPGSLPVSFWNPPGVTANGTQMVERGGNLAGTVVNDSATTSSSMRSAVASSAWNFFANAVTWKVRGVSMTSSGATPLPMANAFVRFSIMSGSGTGFGSEDAANVEFRGDGRLILYLKTNATVGSWGTAKQTVMDPAVNGYDLTMGPESGGSVPYTFTVKKSIGADVVLTGSWTNTQADWSDGGTGATSYLQVFAQENLSTTDITQKFDFTVGSYAIISGANTILRDEFDEDDLARVNEFPSGLSTALSSGYDQVFVDGEMQHEARLPNFGGGDMLHPATASVTVKNASATTNPNSVTATEFGGKATNFFAGARFYGGVGKSTAWQNALVKTSSGNILIVDPATKSNWWNPDDDGPQNVSDTGVGFVFGLLSLLDADGEWFLNQATLNLSLRIAGAGDPSGHLVEIKRRNWCVDVNTFNYITVRGLTTRGGAILLNGTGNVLENCEARFLSHYLTFSQGSKTDGGRTQGGGVVVGGAGCTVQRCTIYDTAGSGIVSTGSGHFLTRNHIYNTDYSGTYACCMSLTGAGEIATFNTMHDTGRDVLRPKGTGQTVMFNDLSGSGKLCKDLGGVYSSNNDGVGTRIAYNWVHDGNLADPRSKGIYLDNYCRNYRVDHNVIWNLGTDIHNDGIHMNSPGDGHELYHNTLFSCNAYNHGTFTIFPDNNPDPTHWTASNNHLDYTAQNNLVLTDSGTSLENTSANDFRPKSGSTAIDAVQAPGITTWTTTNGSVNVPSDFTLVLSYPDQAFTYAETTGQGVALPGITDFVPDDKPDSGAYEAGGAYWVPGVNGWAIDQPGIVSNPASNVTATTATANGTLISAGTAATTVNLYWGTNDGGSVPTGWAHVTTLGTNFTGTFQTLLSQLTGLTPSTIYWYRYCSTNSNGDTWSDPQSFSTPADNTPPTLSPVSIASGNAHPTWAKLGDTVTVSFTASEPIQTPGVTLLGVAATVANPSGNNWTATATVGAGTAQGTAAFAIAFSDLSGNAGNAVSAMTDTSSVTVDRTLPVLTLPANIIAEATSAAGRVVTFSTSATDNLDPAPVVAATPATGSTFPLGTNTVNVSATDVAGNTTNSSFTVTVQDTTAPTVAITFPTSSATFTTTSSSLDVSGTASDEVDVAQVTWANSVGGSGTAMGLSSWSVSAIPLQLGTNVISVTARDAAVNMRTATLTVTRQTFYQSWASQNSLIGSNSGPTNDFDRDGVLNLAEWAYGLNPRVSDGGPIVVTNGVITQRGTPTLTLTNIANSVAFRALYGRRKDRVAVGLGYTVQFSADLGTWQSSAAMPTVIADDGVIEAVTVPYPFFPSNGYFRVMVTAP